MTNLKAKLKRYLKKERLKVVGRIPPKTGFLYRILLSLGFSKVRAMEICEEARGIMDENH